MGYAWLAEKKEQEMAKKLQRRGMPSYRQLPVSERYGVSYTGRGPDGKLQPQAPAGMEGRHIFHEGEMKADTPEGSMYLDAKTTGMAYPETEQQQAEMKMFEKSGNLPGFAAGGFASRLINAASSAILPQPIKTAQSAVNTAVKAVTTNPNTNPNSGVSPGRTDPRSNIIPTPRTVAERTIPQTVADKIMPTTVQNQIQPQIVQNQVPVAGQAVSERTMPAMVENRIAPQIVENKIPGSQTIAERTIPQPEVVQNLVQPVDDQEVTDQRAERMAAQLRETNRQAGLSGTQGEVVPPVVDNKSIEDQARQQGMNWFLDALNKENPALMLEGRRALDELSSRQQQERSALEQQLIQQGVDPGRARVESRMLRDTQESELNDLASKFGIAGMKSRQEIAGTLATQGLQGQQFEAERNQYKDNADWKAYEAAIAAGDFDTAAQAYQRVTGKPINMDQMRTYQNFLNTRNQQELTSGDLDNDAKKFNLTTAKMQAMISDINNGVPLATINQTYGTNLDQGAYDSIGEKYKITMDSLRTKYTGDKINIISDAINKGASLDQINAQFPGTNLSLADYKAMQEATPLGERTWERNMSFAKTLLEAGGEANIQAAAGIFNQAFPGSGIDFSKLVTADKAASFNSGMNQLGTYVAAGMDYETAIEAMKKDGTLDMLGMSESDVEKLYRGVKVNAIDEQWKTISDSEWYKGLPPDQQKDMSDFFTAVLSGELDYSIQKEYTVTEKDGTTKTMYFNTEADANSYATKNGATIVNTGKTKVSPRTTTDDIGTNVTNKVPDATGKAQGTVFIENGKTWKVGADGKATELSMPTEIWGSDADAVLKAGREGNPLYDDIMEQRVNDVVSAPNLDNLSKIKAISQEHYQEAVSKIPKASVGYNDNIVTDTISTQLSEGDTTKIVVNGVEIPVKVTVLGKAMVRFGGDLAYMEFVDADGNYYSVGGFDKHNALRSKTIVPGRSENYDKIVGGNLNRE